MGLAIGINKYQRPLDIQVAFCQSVHMLKTGRERLAAYRDKCHLNQNELADLLQLDYTYVSQIITGVRRPGLETAIRIEAVTGIPVKSWSATIRGNPGRAFPRTKKKQRVGKELTDHVGS